MPNRPCTAPSTLAHQTDSNLRSNLPLYLSDIIELRDHFSRKKTYQHHTPSVEETIQLCDFFSAPDKNHLYQYTSEGFSLASKIYDLLSIIERESKSNPNFVRKGFRMDYRHHALSVLSWCTTTLITPPNEEGTASHFYGEDFNKLLLHFKDGSIFHRHFHETCQPKRDMSHEYDWIFGFLRLAMLPPLPEQVYWHTAEVLRENTSLSSLKDLDGKYYDTHAIANFVVREIQIWEDASIIEFFNNNFDNFKSALALIQQDSNEISTCDKPKHISERTMTMYEQLSSLSADDLPIDDPCIRYDLFEYVSLLQSPGRHIPEEPKRTYLQKVHSTEPSAQYYYDTDPEWDKLEQSHRDAARDRPYTMIEKIILNARKQAITPHPKSYNEHIRQWLEKNPDAEYPDEEKSSVYLMALQLKRAVTLRFPNNQEDTVSAETLTIDSKGALYNRDTYLDYYKHLDTSILQALRAKNIHDLQRYIEKAPKTRTAPTNLDISRLIQASCAKSITELLSSYLPATTTDDPDASGSEDSDSSPTQSPQAKPHFSHLEIRDTVSQLQEALQDCHNKTDPTFLFLEHLSALLIHGTPPAKSADYRTLKHSDAALHTNTDSSTSFAVRNLYQELEDCAKECNQTPQDKLIELHDFASKLSQTLPQGSAKNLKFKIQMEKRKIAAQHKNQQLLTGLEQLLTFLQENPTELLENSEALKQLNEASLRHETATTIDTSKHLALDNGDIFSSTSLLDYNTKRPPSDDEKARPFADGTVVKSIQNPYDRQPVTTYVINQIKSQGYRFGTSPDCKYLLTYCVTADNLRNQARYDQELLEQYGHTTTEICPTTLHQMYLNDESGYINIFLERQRDLFNNLYQSLSMYWDFTAETNNDTCHENPEHLQVENLQNLQAAIGYLRNKNHRTGLPVLQNHPDYVTAFLQLEQLHNGLSDREMFAQHSLRLPPALTTKLFGYIRKDNPTTPGHRITNTWVARNLLLFAQCIHPDSFEDYPLFILWAYRSVNEVMIKYKTFDIQAMTHSLVAPSYADAVVDDPHTNFCTENVRELTSIGKYLSSHSHPESPYSQETEAEHDRFQRKLASIYQAMITCRMQIKPEFRKNLEKELLPVIGPKYSAIIKHYNELYEQCSNVKYWYLHQGIYKTLKEHFTTKNYADNEQNRRDIEARRAEIEQLRKLCEVKDEYAPCRQDVISILEPKQLSFFDRGSILTLLHKLFADIKVIESVKSINMVETPEALRKVLQEYEKFKKTLHCHMVTMPQDSPLRPTPF